MGLDVAVSLEARPAVPQELPLFDELADIRTGADGADGSPATPRAPSRIAAYSPESSEGRSTLNDKYTFDAFVTGRSEEHTSELQSLMRISYAVFCLKKKKHNTTRL